jgi:DNA-binding MarR family transcriptional regulator
MRDQVSRGMSEDQARTNHTAQTQAIAELLDSIGRMVHVRGYSSGLNPAQWAALRFFRRANPSARTPTGFARANGTTHGTATQTIAALVRKGYLSRAIDPDDRRSVRVAVTRKGATLLETDPLNDLAAAVGEVAPQSARFLASELATVIQRFAQRRD